LARGRLWRGLDKPDLAAADFNKALDLFPPPTDWETANWGAPRARAEHEIAADQSVLDRLVAIRPDDAHLRLTAARRHAMFSRWKEALKGYAPVVRQLATGDEWAEYAGLLWLTDDRAGYRAFLEWMAARFNPDAWYDSFVMTRAVLPGDSRIIEPERLAAAMEEGVKAEQTPWVLHASGLALLRAGHMDRAINRFNESRRDSRWGSQNHALNELGLALAAVSQGDFATATRWYDEAVAHTGTGTSGIWP